jgi:hypothetical protein
MSKFKPTPRPKSTPKPAQPAPAPAAVVPPPDWTALADKYAVPALVGLLIVGFALRVINLDALSLWVDEYVHVFRAKNFNEGKGDLFTNDNNGILLTMVIIPFFKIMGTTAFWARFPSVLFGVGSIYLLYRIGTQLLNRYVGLLAAFAGTFSLYLIFWSKIARNYAIFAFFGLLLGLVFLKAFEGKENPEAGNFWERHGFNPKYWMLFPVVLIAAMLSHQLTFFFAFTVGIYGLTMALGKIIHHSADRFSNKYFWLAASTLPFLLLVLPGVNDLLRGPLSTLLSKEQVDWVLPQSAHLSELWKTQPWNAFGIYHGVLRYDTTLLYFPAVAGLLVSFRLKPQVGAWLLGAVVTPFLLMSFLFRDPALPRYFIFVFPWFLMSASVFFYWMFRYFTTDKPTISNTVRYGLLFFPFVFMLASVRWKEVKKLVLAEQREGHVTNNNISQFNFTNWQAPCDFVNQNRKPGDVLMSTVTTAASFYLKEDSVLWFRQMRYDTKSKKYVFNDQEPQKKHSAATLEDLQRTVANAPRGWLLADYYLDNKFVDDRARMFLYQNMYFYPEASPDGSVMVFGWDHSRPKPQQQSMVVQLGKASDKVISSFFYMNITPELLQTPTVSMRVRTQGVDSNREGLIVLNDQNASYLAPNKGKGIETQTLTIPREWLRPGNNQLQIVYEEKVKSDPDKGFTVYDIAF